MPRKRNKPGDQLENPAKIWDHLAWKTVSTENADLGDFEDAVFLGLEEIDGNAYKLKKMGSTYAVSSTAEVAENRSSSDESTMQPKKKRKTLKQLREENILKKKAESIPVDTDEPVVSKISDIVDTEVFWGTVQLHSALQNSLIGLGFANPTPIQSQAIPKVFMSYRLRYFCT